MLEPWIIEQIRRREEEERRRSERPQLELPVPAEPWPPRREADETDEDDEQKRGVVIIGI
jgi:hypothetical protein